ncbi:MAG: hypothetical protein ABIH41_00985, partial [Nanoarchaeota archaeon]
TQMFLFLRKDYHIVGFDHLTTWENAKAHSTKDDSGPILWPTNKECVDQSCLCLYAGDIKEQGDDAKRDKGIVKCVGMGKDVSFTSDSRNLPFVGEARLDPPDYAYVDGMPYISKKSYLIIDGNDGTHDVSIYKGDIPGGTLISMGTNDPSLRNFRELAATITDLLAKPASSTPFQINIDKSYTIVGYDRRGEWNPIIAGDQDKYTWPVDTMCGKVSCLCLLYLADGKNTIIDCAGYDALYFTMAPTDSQVKQTRTLTILAGLAPDPLQFAGYVSLSPDAPLQLTLHHFGQSVRPDPPVGESTENPFATSEPIIVFEVGGLVPDACQRAQEEICGHRYTEIFQGKDITCCGMKCESGTCKIDQHPPQPSSIFIDPASPTTYCSGANTQGYDYWQCQ